MPKRKAVAKTKSAASSGSVAATATARPIANKPSTTPPPKTAPSVVGSVAPAATPMAVPPLAPLSERLALFDTMRQEVAACQKCPELCSTRTQTVFGVGNVSAKICFLGEAPGADEDRQGEPFVGRAGQLLTKMIEACQLKREEVYILNVLKCRPPGNRNPLPDEVANCRGFFERQLDIIRPEMICCLGAWASQSLLQTDVTIGRLRKQFHDFRGIKVICTYHPAYLLRNPAAKGDTWADLKMMMRHFGVVL